jgi:hypothetical protein
VSLIPGVRVWERSWGKSIVEQGIEEQARELGFDSKHDRRGATTKVPQMRLQVCSYMSFFSGLLAYKRSSNAHTQYS